MGKRRSGLLGILFLVLALTFASGSMVRAEEAPDAETPPLCGAVNRSALKGSIVTALVNSETVLDVSGYGLVPADWDDVKNTFYQALDENPDLFYVKKTLSYSGTTSAIKRLTFQLDTVSNADKQKFALKVQEAVSLLDSSMGDAEKALVLHDYVATHCAYALEEFNGGAAALEATPHVYDAYGALVRGKAVCEGYTRAYNVLLNAAGIENGVCSSSAMGHTWNAVKIDGKWYNVDVTWDDPAWNTEGKVLHKYFLLSDAALTARDTDHSDPTAYHHDWTSTVDAAVSNKYDSENYWWSKIQSQIIFANGKIYYIGLDQYYHFHVYEKDGDTVQGVYNSTANWTDGDDSMMGYTGQYAFLSRKGNFLFFNDPTKLYALNLANKFSVQPLTTISGYGYIYGAMVYENGEARVNMRKRPNDNKDVYTTADVDALMHIFGSGPSFKAVTGLTLTQSAINMKVGESAALKVTVAPADATNPGVVWSCDKQDVLSIENGILFALKAGTVTVTATAKDGSGKSASCKVTVTGSSAPASAPETPSTASPETPAAPAPETPAAVETGWHTEGGISYWYENGVKQGVKLNADGKPDKSYRGKEIYDPESDEWYWLDNVQYGAIAKSKDVYQESQADDAGTIGKWVRYDDKGHMVKGWDTNQKGSYYFDPVYGTMLKGDQVIDGVNYHFDEGTGIMTYCSISLENHWEIIDGAEYWYENGQRQGKDDVHKNYRGKEIYDPVSNAWYWLDNVDAGKKAVSKDVYQESKAGEWGDKTNEKGEKIGKWVRYDAEGRMIKGWCAGKYKDGEVAMPIDSPDQAAGRDVYYFDFVYGTMAKGEVVIDGQTYYFDEMSGVLRQ